MSGTAFRDPPGDMRKRLGRAGGVDVSVDPLGRKIMRADVLGS